MGFGLTFMRMGGEGTLDADRAGVQAFLDERGLSVAASNDASCHLCDADGEQLHFDGQWSDLHVNRLDHPDHLTGGIWNASLTEAEIDFVFDLCVAAGWLVVNHQGGTDSAMFIVPAGNHTLAEVEAVMPEPSIAFVDDAPGLGIELSGDVERFVEWRTRVLKGET